MERSVDPQEPIQYTRTENILYSFATIVVIILAASHGLEDEKAFFFGFKALLACFAVGLVLHTFSPKGNWLIRLSVIAVAGAQLMSLIGHPLV